MTDEYIHEALEAALTAPPGSVVIFRGLPPAVWEHMMEVIADRPSKFGDHLFLSMPMDTDVVALNEDDLNRAGWVRSDKQNETA